MTKLKWREYYQRVLIGVGVVTFFALFISLTGKNSTMGAELKKASSQKDIKKTHGLLILLGFFLLNAGICVHLVPAFKLKKISRRLLLTIHLGVQVAGVFFLLIGVLLAMGKGSGGKKTGLAHVVAGSLLLLAILAQMTLALVYFFVRHENEKWIYYFQFHGRIGLWLIVALLGSFLTGIGFQLDRNLSDKVLIQDQFKTYSRVGSTTFFVLVPIILLQHYKAELLADINEVAAKSEA